MTLVNGSRIEDYVKVERIGSGSYGVVFKGRHKRTGEVVAMKKVALQSAEDGIPGTSVREVSLLRDLRHPNIVQLRDIVMGDDRIYLIFEYLTMDLKQYIRSAGKVEKMLTKTYSYQILQGILYCHQRRIMHRDLKPENLLIAKDGSIKIADLGCARSFGVAVRLQGEEVVTRHYRAPEILLGSTQYGAPVDMWSVGAIMAEMVTGEVLFPGESDPDQLARICGVLGPPSELTWPGVTQLPRYPSVPRQAAGPGSGLEARLGGGCDPDMVELVTRLLVLCPDTRATATTALEHATFAHMDTWLSS